MQGIGLLLLVILVATHLYFDWKRNLRLKAITKIAASTLFVVLAYMSGLFTNESFGPPMLVAMLFCWVGDILLLYHAQSKQFLGGILCFGAGHLAFIVGLISAKPPFDWTVFAIVFLVALVFGAKIAASIWSRLTREFKPAIVGYVILISCLVGVAASVQGEGASAYGVYAAMAFYISDISVARDQFGGLGFSQRLWGIPLYYLAQALFALG